MPRRRERGSPTFEALWPDLAGQLRAQLARGGAPAWLIDDVIQETALRLLQKWNGLDRGESLFPWAATVAHNVLVDHYRAAARLTDEEVPDIAVDHVEDAALARVELERVCKALGQLNPRYRDVLLAEIGDSRGSVPTSRLARNSARMRARRQLVAILQTMRGLVATGGLSLRRMWRDLYVRATKVRNTLALESVPQGIAAIIVVAVLVGGIGPGDVDGTTTPKDGTQETTTRIELMSDVRSPSSDATEIGPGMVTGPAPTTGNEPARNPDARAAATPLTSRWPRYAAGATNRIGFGEGGYDIKQDGSYKQEGQKVTWKYRHRFETPSCVENVANEKPPGTCEMRRGPEGFVEVTAAGQRRRVEYGDRNH